MKSDSTIAPQAEDRGSALGVVLAGGDSRRMGRDKSTLEIQREGRPWTMLGWTLERLGRVVPEVVVAAGSQRSQDTGALTYVPDGPGRGPAAGILGAAAMYPGRPLLVLASDIPEAPPQLLRALLATAAQTGCEWVTVRTRGVLHPLCALYRPPVLEALRTSAESGHFSLWDLYRNCTLRRITLETKALGDLGGGETNLREDPALILRNVNTPDDYEAARGGLHSSQEQRLRRKSKR